MEQTNLIHKRDLISVFFRSFFIQAVWNFKSLVSVGICFALVPVARRLCDKEKVCTKFLKRHLYFFNAHPFFASYALGAITRLEEDRVKGIIKDEAQIERFKNALIGPLGAIGDQYFWASIKPGAILTGLAGIALAGDLRVQLALLILALLLYNLPHFYIRLLGLWKGYKQGYAVVKNLKMEKFSRVAKIYLFIGASMLGAFFGYTAASYTAQQTLAGIIFVVSMLLVVLLQRLKLNFYLITLIIIFSALIAGSL